MLRAHARSRQPTRSRYLHVQSRGCDGLSSRCLGVERSVSAQPDGFDTQVWATGKKEDCSSLASSLRPWRHLCQICTVPGGAVSVIAHLWCGLCWVCVGGGGGCAGCAWVVEGVVLGVRGC